jgi:hypothetical protein
LQTFVSQSLPLLQPSPASHDAQVGPPQSMSVSWPFSTPSWHVGCLQVPPSQSWLVQSSSFEQLPPGAQVEHSGPPQSTSVSRPFWTLSSQVG